MEFTNGLTAESMKDNGKTTKWTDMESLSGRTAKNIKETTLRIKKKDMENFFGQMVEFTEATGSKGNNMGMAHILEGIKMKGKLNGKKEKELKHLKKEIIKILMMIKNDNLPIK